MYVPRTWKKATTGRLKKISDNFSSGESLEFELSYLNCLVEQNKSYTDEAIYSLYKGTTKNY